MEIDILTIQNMLNDLLDTSKEEWKEFDNDDYDYETRYYITHKDLSNLIDKIIEKIGD